MTETKIIEERFMPAALAAVPARIRAAIAAAADYRFDEEETDYLGNCSDEPGDNQRTGHPFEDLSLLRRWLEGNVDGAHVDTEVWVNNPVPAPGGYHCLTMARRKTIREVHAELLTLVGRREDDGFTTVDGADDYFSVHAGVGGDGEWPEGRIVVFPVTGSSEGWYTHVEVQGADGQSRLLILGKGFDGADAAWTLARRLAGILGV